MEEFKESAPKSGGKENAGKKPGVKKSQAPAKPKACQFCVDHADDIDYKDVAKLKKFTTEGGKIMPRRASGICTKQQRFLTTAIKRARQMALLPYRTD